LRDIRRRYRSGRGKGGRWERSAKKEGEANEIDEWSVKWFQGKKKKYTAAGGRNWGVQNDEPRG